jgi:hypothetical protein
VRAGQRRHPMGPLLCFATSTAICGISSVPIDLSTARRIKR